MKKLISNNFDNQKTENMIDKKMTAIEWLEMEIVKLEKDYAIPYIIYILCQQAKEMEKEQIENAWCDGNDNEPLETTKFMGEQYYKETYEQ